MPRSMTGFGRAEFKNAHYEISAEIRCLNNRYLDLGLRLPKSLSGYEFKIKELIKKYVYRGKLTLNLNFKDLSLSNGNFKINKESVQTYYRILQQLKKHAGIDEEITIDHLLHFAELIEPEEKALEDSELQRHINKVVQKALTNLNEMRSKEAKNIGKDIAKRIDHIENIVDKIKNKNVDNPRIELNKQFNRLRELIESGKVDKDRLEQELSLIADRVDVTEECTRLKSHLKLFKETFEKKEEVGKKLTFILQEMLREINTIGSKTTLVTVSHLVIRLKEEIEKLREQAQNLE